MLKRFSNNLGLPKIDRIFWQARFPERRTCISCNYRKLFKISNKQLRCKRCLKKFSITTNTYLSKSRISLDQWYELIWWFVYDFTANRTAKETGLSQKLVHRCFSVIRKAISDYEETVVDKFLGQIEVDETYVGPKFRNRRKSTRDKARKVNVVKRGRGSKTLTQPVFGIYQRNGTVYVEFISDASKKTLQDIIKGRISLDSEVYSDTWRGYHGLKGQGYKHQTIDHGKEEYVRKSKQAKVHINGIEGFWGYLKQRLLKHHGVAKENLIYYVKEQEFRFNNRHLSSEEMVNKIINILMNFSPVND